MLCKHTVFMDQVQSEFMNTCAASQRARVQVLCALLSPWNSLPGLPEQIPQPGRLTQQKLISSQFWRLEIQYQSVCGVGFF